MSKTVYLCFSTDIIHGGHIAIIRKAQQLGTLIVGVWISFLPGCPGISTAMLVPTVCSPNHSTRIFFRTAF